MHYIHSSSLSTMVMHACNTYSQRALTYWLRAYCCQAPRTVSGQPNRRDARTVTFWKGAGSCSDQLSAQKAVVATHGRGYSYIDVDVVVAQTRTYRGRLCYLSLPEAINNVCIGCGYKMYYTEIKAFYSWGHLRVMFWFDTLVLSVLCSNHERVLSKHCDRSTELDTRAHHDEHNIEALASY